MSPVKRDVEAELAKHASIFPELATTTNPYILASYRRTQTIIKDDTITELERLKMHADEAARAKHMAQLIQKEALEELLLDLAASVIRCAGLEKEVATAKADLAKANAGVAESKAAEEAEVRQLRAEVVKLKAELAQAGAEEETCRCKSGAEHPDDEEGGEKKRRRTGDV